MHKIQGNIYNFKHKVLNFYTQCTCNIQKRAKRK